MMQEENKHFGELFKCSQLNAKLFKLHHKIDHNVNLRANIPFSWLKCTQSTAEYADKMLNAFKELIEFY